MLEPSPAKPCWDGFRFFETHKLYAGAEAVASPRIWLGKNKTIPVGFQRGVYVTVPQGQRLRLKATMDIASPLKAPIQKGQSVGNLHITLAGEPIANVDVVALEGDPKGGWWRRFCDRIGLMFHRLFHR